MSFTKPLKDPIRGHVSNDQGPTEKEVNKILDNFRAEYVKRYATGDPEQLLQMYHPEAVVIHVGQFAKHQHDAIREVLKKWIKEQPKVEFEEHTIRRFSASNGDYLFSVGVLTLNFPNGKKVKQNYESIYRLHEGRYLLYYDRAEYAV
uniref:SnoaL-like domain-containing protein n=1 Tax=Acrobeloides nanus TaxID=290746 RepID=A0A914BZZ6_9BILA